MPCNDAKAKEFKCDNYTIRIYDTVEKGKISEIPSYNISNVTLSGSKLNTGNQSEF